jgi:hypothetical protein
VAWSPSGHQPSQLSDEQLVSELKALELHASQLAKDLFEPGQLVKFLAGPFLRGLEGIVKKRTSSERALVVLDLTFYQSLAHGERLFERNKIVPQKLIEVIFCALHVRSSIQVITTALNPLNLQP